MDDSIDFSNFYVRVYCPVIEKDSFTHIHGLSVYIKKLLRFAWDLSLGNSADSYLFLTCFTSFSVLLLFPLLITVFVFMHSF